MRREELPHDKFKEKTDENIPARRTYRYGEPGCFLSVFLIFLCGGSFEGQCLLYSSLCSWESRYISWTSSEICWRMSDRSGSAEV